MDRLGDKDKEVDILIKKQTMIRQNTKNIKDVYKIHKKAIGSGAFGVVTKVTHLVSKQERACKTIARKKVKNLA